MFTSVSMDRYYERLETPRMWLYDYVGRDSQCAIVALLVRCVDLNVLRSVTLDLVPLLCGIVLCCNPHGCCYGKISC